MRRAREMAMVLHATPSRWRNSSSVASGCCRTSSRSRSQSSGATAALAFPGATNTEMVENDVADVLVPKLKPGDVVIWDNPQPHQSDEAIEAVEGAGARVVPLPPYSPDLTPIEEMFSKVKGAMRSAAARTTETVDAAFCSAWHDVTPNDIAGWFGDRAAYAMQP